MTTPRIVLDSNVIISGVLFGEAIQAAFLNTL